MFFLPLSISSLLFLLQESRLHQHYFLNNVFSFYLVSFEASLKKFWLICGQYFLSFFFNWLYSPLSLLGLLVFWFGEWNSWCYYFKILLNWFVHQIFIIRIMIRLGLVYYHSITVRRGKFNLLYSFWLLFNLFLPLLASGILRETSITSFFYKTWLKKRHDASPFKTKHHIQ